MSTQKPPGAGWRFFRTVKNAQRIVIDVQYVKEEELVRPEPEEWYSTDTSSTNKKASEINLRGSCHDLRCYEQRGEGLEIRRTGKYIFCYKQKSPPVAR